MLMSFRFSLTPEQRGAVNFSLVMHMAKQIQLTKNSESIGNDSPIDQNILDTHDINIYEAHGAGFGNELSDRELNFRRTVSMSVFSKGFASFFDKIQVC